MMSMRKRSGMLRAATVTAVAAAAALLPAAPAQAAANGDYTGSGVRIRGCPTTSCTTHGLGYRGQGAAISCFRYGEYTEGTSIWYYHRNRTTGVVGYSHSRYIDYHIGTVPQC